VLAFQLLAQRFADFDPQQTGLGENTTSVEDARFDGRRVNLISADPGSVRELTETVRSQRAAQQRIALWLGASQLHAINDIQPSDRLAVVHANERGTRRNAPLAYVQFSAANANFHELLAVYLFLRSRGLSPDWLIAAVTYDDLREPGVRAEFAEMARAGLQALERPRGTGVHNLIREIETAAQTAATKDPVARSAVADTPQEALERALNRTLEGVWPAYRERGAVRAGLEVLWANAVVAAAFKVRGRPVVHVPEELASWNLEALDSLLEVAREDGVRVLLYRAPHRPGEARFYHDRAEYDRFFVRLGERCDERSVSFADLETIVPAEHWGVTNTGQPDVFHFSGVGHQALGSAVDSLMEKAD